MNYAALWIRNFALLAVQRNEPGLGDRPVALITGEGRKAAVAEMSPEAIRVTVGLAVPLAIARCPGLQLRERDPVAEVEVQRILVAAAFALSPRVEITARDCYTVDLQGADPGRTEAEMRRQVLELQRLGLPVRIGAGETPLLARYAARRAEPVLIVREREEFLRDLPLDFSEPSPQHLAILQGWGIRTLGELTALPKADVGERLGPDGAALWDRAHGESPRVLRLTEPVRTWIASWNYEPPVETIEPLLFKLRRYAERLALELRSTGWAAETLALTLLLEDETDYRRQFRLSEPGTDIELWLRVMQTHLDTVRLDERVAGVRLIATPARPELRQDSLFDTVLADPASFWENLARLAALVGEGRVGTPVWQDSHAPDAFLMGEPSAIVSAPEAVPLHPSRGGVLRRFRPAWPVRVFCEGQEPVAIEGAVRGDICSRVGPHILRGNWWKPGTWAIETWQVELTAGGLYQLSRDATGWWIEGTLD